MWKFDTFYNDARIADLFGFTNYIKTIKFYYIEIQSNLKRMGVTINGVGRGIDQWQLDSSVCFLLFFFVNKDIFFKTNLNTDLYHVGEGHLKKKFQIARKS